MPAHLDSYTETPEGKLLIFDGLNPVKIWDGLMAAPVDAGLDAPASAVTIASGGGHGKILGDYAVFCRFVDDAGNVSNLSPVSATFTAAGTPLTITGASNEFPVKITTSGAHGLSTGDFVRVAGVQGNEAANGTWRITVTSSTTFTMDDSNGDGTHTSGGTATPGLGTLNYSAIPVPTSSKVTKKQILRNTDGQLTTFYVDVEMTNVAATTASSTRSDDNLAAQEAVPLLVDNVIFADANAKPPDFMTCAANLLGRVFACVNKVYTDGAVGVVNGSPTVSGIATRWTASMAGRFLYVLGASKTYEIQSVNVGLQTLTLTANYTDGTLAYTTYSIKPAPAYRRQAWYSRAGKSEAWSPTYALDIQDTGDELTGVMAQGPFVFFLERAHIHKLTFQTDPAIDGHVFGAGERGCVNNRCWVPAAGKTFMLDEQGIHAFQGGQEPQPISTPVQSMFSLEGTAFTVNWRASDLFHGVYSPHEETARWFVSMGSNTKPYHAIAFHVALNRWWIEEYRQPITSSVLARRASRRVVFLGGEGGVVSAVGRSYLDGLDPNRGTSAGTVGAADVASLTDGSATFPAGLAGLSVSIVKGRGYPQTRVIHANTGTRLRVTEPWSVKPDASSVYQIAGVPWYYFCKAFEWYEPTEDREVYRRLALFFERSKNEPAWMNVRVFEDGSDDPKQMATTTDGEDYDGVSGTADNPYLAMKLTRPAAHAQQRWHGHRDKNFDGPRTVEFELSGVAGRDGVRIQSIILDGASE